MIRLHAGVVAEPSAAADVAAILENPESFDGMKVGPIARGGNLTEPVYVKRSRLASSGWSNGAYSCNSRGARSKTRRSKPALAPRRLRAKQRV